MAEQYMQQQRNRDERNRPNRAPASWRRFAGRPRNPVTGVSMAGPWSSLKPYALKLLKHEHRILRRMLKELTHAKTAGERNRRLARCEAEYVAYSRVAREVFYPAYRANCKTARQRMHFHAVSEGHRGIELILLDLNRCDPGSAKWAGCGAALRVACADLFRGEERHVFHHARRLLGRRNLKSLGRAMQDHRRAILRTPNLPPRMESPGA